MPYRSDDTVERGVTMTREVLRATVDLARARGATPLIVVPQFGVEAQAERTLRRRILDETGLPYVWIEIDEAWRLPGIAIRTRAPLTRSPSQSRIACKGAKNSQSHVALRCRSRARNGQRSANASGRILMATSRSSRASRARYTSPIPPAPMAERISYGPRCVPGAMATVCEADYTGRTPIRRDYSA